MTARYELDANISVEEVKFFTDEDVLLNIVSLVPYDQASATQEATLLFGGQSYVNTETVGNKDTSSKGLPPDTQYSRKRNSTSKLDTLFSSSGCGSHLSSLSPPRCSAVHVLEKGTALAKPIDCKFAPFPPGVDCLLKEGKMMYDGMSVFIAASQDISPNAAFGFDEDHRATYNFSLKLTSGTPLVGGCYALLRMCTVHSPEFALCKLA